jgi:hypothetical protein
MMHLRPEPKGEKQHHEPRDGKRSDAVLTDEQLRQLREKPVTDEQVREWREQPEQGSRKK